MPIDSIAALGPLPALQPLGAPQSASDGQPAGAFAGVLNSVLGGNVQAEAAADAAIRDLATGNAQDLHSVTMAVAQADLSFRLILELRNRISDAIQEITRMQV